MAETKYPVGTVRALLGSNLVTEPTRAALTARLKRSDDWEPAFFSQPEADTLRQLAARLFPSAEGYGINQIAELDRCLADGDRDGWRYNTMPPDADAHRLGAQGWDETAAAQYGSPFAKLTADQQDAVIRLVQDGNPVGDTWQRLPAARYFEELLAELTEIYYSHPLVQEEIGYVGMADTPGWQQIGLNQLAEREPRPLPSPHDARRPQSIQSSADLAKREPRPLPSPPFTPPLPATPIPPQTREITDQQPLIYNLSTTANQAVDVVVVGSGAGGAPLAARLAEGGLRVVILEAGRQWQPERDFATDERAQGRLYWPDERLSAGDNPTAFGRNNSGIGVGGSTLHYTAYTPRAQPNDFRLRTEFGVGCDWPISYADLEPYYEELETFLGISGPTPYPWGPPRTKGYPLAPLPLNGAAQLMQRACASFGIRTSPAANAALSGSYYQPGVGWRPACTNRGFCQAGCSVGAKASMDVTFIPLALQYGAELRAECFVTEIERDAHGKVTGVVYVHDGVEQRQACRALFLCAGAVETPRLLLRMGLANSSGQVGRNFMAHVGTQVWGRFDAEVRPYKGIPGGLISEDNHRPDDAGFAGGYVLQSIGVMPVTYAAQLSRGRGLWGEGLRERMLDYNHVAGINILGECLPSTGNYLELSDELDGRGLPKPRIYFSYGENERKMQAHAESLMRALWTAAGGHDLWTFQRSAHTIGTCRMGADGSNAVVDGDGRSFDSANLYIVDNSIFPSALSVNPALTIMALALRVGDRYLMRLQRREA